MAEYLLIRLPREAEEHAAWVVLQEGSSLAPRLEKGELSHAAAMSAGRRVVLIVPGDEVLLTEVSVPTRKRQKILRAVPYALEEQVADDVENLHFALGPQLDGGSYPVAIVAHSCVQRWLEKAADAGLSVDMVVPDSLLVPVNPAGWSVVLERDQVLLRTGPFAAFCADRECAETMIALMVHGTDQETVHLTQYCCDGELPLQPRAGLESAQAPCDDSALALFARHFNSGSVINLLQGPFSRQEQLSQLWRPWQATAALLMLGLLLVAVQRGLEYRALSQEKQQLSQRIEQIYRDVFPDAKRVVNPRAQMQQHLLELRQDQAASEDGFLALLSLCGGVLKATPNVQLQGASYREGRMDLDITATDLQVLDQLKQRLSATGQLEVEIQSATSGANQQVQSRLRLRKAGA
ncbi:MAG: type II secretion system protein GspL [Gammaproteobacteria bacterium]